MEAKHSHPNRPDNTVDLINVIHNNELPFFKGHWLAEVMWEDKKLVSVYLHRIEGVILATTHLNSVQDSYAVVVDGRAMFAYNIGRFPAKDVFIFDREHYQALEYKPDRYQYLAYTCLQGDGLPDDLLVMLHDQHAKSLVEELYAPALSV